MALSIARAASSLATKRPDHSQQLVAKLAKRSVQGRVASAAAAGAVAGAGAQAMLGSGAGVQPQQRAGAGRGLGGTAAPAASISSRLPRGTARSLLFAASVAAAALVVAGAFPSNGNGHIGAQAAAGPKNVFGRPLSACSTDPLTGFMRNGFCETGPTDFGTHTVCAKVTDEFLEYTRQQGNDLITPRPEHRFPGLKEGDGWCLCASRWAEAVKAGVAPPVVLEATHEKTLQYVDTATLQRYAK